MINRISSFIQVGNNYQNNTIICNTKIDISVKRLEKDFHDGNIKQAMEDLSSLMDENKDDKKIRYQLLVKKASFFFSLRRYDEAIKLVENIEKNYTGFIDVSLEEIKLIELSLNKKEKDFFVLADKIISESSNDLKRINFELMYYLNCRDIEKAKTIFDNLKDEDKSTKEFSIMGGHIYANTPDSYKETDAHYQVALSHQISFLEKAVIYGFYGTDIINKYMYGQSFSEKSKDTLITYKKIINQIIENETYFESSYIVGLKDTYLALLLVLGDREEYIEFYEKENKHDYIWNQHYLQYVNIKNISIEHKKVQSKILTNNSERLLLMYMSIIDKKNDDSKEVLSFLDRNLDLIYENRYVLFFYIQGKLFFGYSLDDVVLLYIKSHKFDNIESIISYLRIHKDTSDQIKQDDVVKLLELANEENIISSRIIETIQILKGLGKRKEYIDLALNKQNIFEGIIHETLTICFDDKNLHIEEFDYFVENIKDKDEYIKGSIADIYAKFNAYSKSFEYFYSLFETENHNINLLLKIIEISFHYFLKSNGRLEEKKEKEIYDILVSKKDNLGLKNLIFLFQYSLVVLKETRQILPTLNQLLLNTNINELDKDIKVELSNLYTQTTIGMSANFDQLFMFESNICYEKDGKIYLKGYKVTEDNKKSFGFRFVDNNKFFTIKNDPRYKQDSLFHKIVGPFAFRVDNPNMIPIQVNLDGENPFGELFTFIDEISQQEKDLFQRYSQEEFYGLYPLAKHDYANYFTLIPYLLEHQDYSLNSLKPSFMIDKKKILTLSSIIFLNYLGYLDKVLKMENIVIPQTTINWIQKYIEDYTPVNRPTKFSYMDEEKPKFIPYTKEEENEAIKFKNELIELTKKLLECEIVDDTNENLPIVGAYKMLAKEMGAQEYHALAYCINHNYQIISENNIFEMLFDTFGYNKPFISNSFALLANILEEDEIYALRKKLFNFNYKYISICPDIERMLVGLDYYGFKNILNGHLLLTFRIWYKYGCMDDLIKEYIHEYKVLYPKKIVPKNDTFSKNMEYLLEILDMSKE